LNFFLLFFVKPGDHIAFVGTSGSGKTTIVRLIERFYDVTNGSLEIDGIKLKDLNMEDVR
jgi:ABC-type multidrug transport system fused ATPase/permease subunit